MAPVAIAVDNTTNLVDWRKDLASSAKNASTNDTQPYVLAINQIRGAMERYRINKESLEDAKETSNSTSIIDDSYRSQSPVGFSIDVKTIEAIERIMQELDRTHPPPKLSHDSSKIEEDLASTADDNGQVVLLL
jgi:uncharacterized circularly permuted ATP-grasp superfamily protein